MAGKQPVLRDLFVAIIAGKEPVMRDLLKELLNKVLHIQVFAESSPLDSWNRLASDTLKMRTTVLPSDIKTISKSWKSAAKYFPSNAR
jgi:hypothetical protein